MSETPDKTMVRYLGGPWNGRIGEVQGWPRVLEVVEFLGFPTPRLPHEDGEGPMYRQHTYEAVTEWSGTIQPYRYRADLTRVVKARLSPAV